jgi:uncharacterized membrane protein
MIVSTNRMESFSDGVLAVAITLLVLNIAVPPSNLGHRLADQWPAYVAYVTSFLTIGIIWVNHHVMMGRLREADYAILMLNVVLLMTVVVIPFGTSLLAAYLKSGAGDHLAAAVYGGILLSMALAFTLLNHHILFRKQHLLSDELSLAHRRKIFFRTVSGVIPYAVAMALAAVSAYITLAMSAALAVFYALPLASGLSLSE